MSSSYSYNSSQFFTLDDIPYDSGNTSSTHPPQEKTPNATRDYTDILMHSPEMNSHPAPLRPTMILDTRITSSAHTGSNMEETTTLTITTPLTSTNVQNGTTEFHPNVASGMNPALSNPKITLLTPDNRNPRNPIAITNNPFPQAPYPHTPLLPPVATKPKPCSTYSNPRLPPRHFMKPTKYNGTTPINAYLQQFELCAKYRREKHIHSMRIRAKRHEHSLRIPIFRKHPL